MFPLKERHPTPLSIAPSLEPLSAGNTVIEEIFEYLAKEHKPQAQTVTNLETVSGYEARAIGVTDHLFLTVDSTGSLSWCVQGDTELITIYPQLSQIPDRQPKQQTPDTAQIETDLRQVVTFMQERPSLSVSEPYHADPVIFNKHGLKAKFPGTMFLTINATYLKDRITLYLGMDMTTGDRLVHVYAGKNFPSEIQETAARINILTANQIHN